MIMMITIMIMMLMNIAMMMVIMIFQKHWPRGPRAQIRNFNRPWAPHPISSKLLAQARTLHFIN